MNAIEHQAEERLGNAFDCEGGLGPNLMGLMGNYLIIVRLPSIGLGIVYQKLTLNAIYLSTSYLNLGGS